MLRPEVISQLRRIRDKVAALAAAAVPTQDEPVVEPDALMRATVWTCCECGGSALRENWDVESALLLRRVRLQIERGEVDADDVWIDTEVAVCPRCKHEHHDDEGACFEESFVQLPPVAASLPAPTETKEQR